MKTSAPKWDPQCRGWRWARYATALLGPVSEERGPHGWIMGAESKGPARTPIQGEYRVFCLPINSIPNRTIQILTN